MGDMSGINSLISLLFALLLDFVVFLGFVDFSILFMLDRRNERRLLGDIDFAGFKRAKFSR